MTKEKIPLAERVIVPKPIVKDLKALKKPCELIETQDGDDELIEILGTLEESLNNKDGYGLAANQIGYNKQVAIIRMSTNTGKVIRINLINPKIIDKRGKFRFQRESCLSFPGLFVDTSRWMWVKIQSGVNGEETHELEGLEAVVAQHEISHLRGQTIFDCKYKKR